MKHYHFRKYILNKAILHNTGPVVALALPTISLLVKAFLQFEEWPVIVVRHTGNVSICMIAWNCEPRLPGDCSSKALGGYCTQF